MEQRPPSTWLRRRVLTFVFFGGAVVLATVAFMVAGVPTGRAVLRGLLFGSCGLALLFAVAEVLVPGQFIRWRAWMIRGSPDPFKQVGDAFDGLLGTRGDAAWKNPQAQRKVRIFGTVLLVVGLAYTAFLWWILSSGGLL